MAVCLGLDKSFSLSMFPAQTGCDTVSAVVGHGKKKARVAWNSFPELTSALLELAHEPTFERFVTLKYAKTSTCTNTEKDKKKLFARTSICEEDSTNTCCSGTSRQKSYLPRGLCLGGKRLFHTHAFFSISIGSGLMLVYMNHIGPHLRNHWRHTMSWFLGAARRAVVPIAHTKKLDWNALHFANAKENVLQADCV